MTPQRQCSNCGHPVAETSAHCGHCGTPVRQPGQPAGAVGPRRPAEGPPPFSPAGPPPIPPPQPRASQAPDVADGYSPTVLVQTAAFLNRSEYLPLPTLDLVKGSASRPRYILGKNPIKIGRFVHNDVVVQDAKASRVHAGISFEGGNYVIEDFNSSNGVYVDEALISKAVLRDGNHIRIGGTVFLFGLAQPDISLEDKVSFLEQQELFNWLDKDTKSLLAQGLVERFFPKDTVVLRQNAPVEAMYFVYSGTVRLAEINVEGGERLIGRLKAGEFFGERALLAGEFDRRSVITDTDLTLLELRKDRLDQLLQQRPDLSKAFYRMVLKKVRVTGTMALPSLPPGLESRPPAALPETTIIGEDRKIKEALKALEQHAQQQKALLVVGAPGTGKHVFARAFHQKGPRKDNPYMEISLTEIEPAEAGKAIFGAEGDASTPDAPLHYGYLEMIGSGTLAIAHAEKLDVYLQSKLAGYLQRGWFHRMNGRESVTGHAAVVLMVSGGPAEVKESLIPELQAFLQPRTIVLPALTQRLKDIPLLAENFLKLCARLNGKHFSRLSREATEKLVSHPWPGNVKELENIIQRAVIMAPDAQELPGESVFVIPRESDVHKLNILRNDRIRGFFLKRWVPQLFMWFNLLIVLAILGLTLYAGLSPEGTPIKEFANNPGMILTWVVWFPILPVTAFLLGRIWCGMCPIAGFGLLVSKLGRLNLPVPKFMKRLDFWLIILAFLFLDYTEELFGVADEPLATAILLIIIFSVATLFFLVFERNTFCRHVCPLAGLLGSYSTLSITEIRGNKQICQTQCGKHYCYTGTQHADGCPMFSYPAALASNTDCMMCFQCMKNCDSRGVQLNLRPPLQELWRQNRNTLSLSLFAIILVGMMARHQFSHLPLWIGWEQSLGWPEFGLQTLLFLGFMSLAVIPFLFCSVIASAASQDRLGDNIARYGIAFLPLAMAGHLSHVGHEFLDEGLYAIINYFQKFYFWIAEGAAIGTRPVTLTPFVEGAVITFIKFLLVSAGALGTLIALVMIARRLSDRAVFARILPYLLLLGYFWAGYLYVFLSSTDLPEPPPPPAAVLTTAGVPATPAETPAAVPGEPGSAPAPVAPPGSPQPGPGGPAPATPANPGPAAP